ncbi:hypothetical protein HPB52_024785 [Rhipicephalus sanguineus]|uniref:Uncharacterized protein n=1 Tax=Rhipicephalus sanguineus TaxID=34632 RepID=A0A9D4YRY8_RHISA|nr:hypothetical protein HPB52_024785 [Rhipicephalus sanguineus]
MAVAESPAKMPPPATAGLEARSARLQTGRAPAKQRSARLYFTPEVDIFLLREVLAVDPFEDSTRWVAIVRNLWAVLLKNTIMTMHCGVSEKLKTAVLVKVGLNGAGENEKEEENYDDEGEMPLPQPPQTMLKSKRHEDLHLQFFEKRLQLEQGAKGRDTELEKERLALEREGLAVEDGRITLEHDRLALDKEVFLQKKREWEDTQDEKRGKRLARQRERQHERDLYLRQQDALIDLVKSVAENIKNY